MSLVKLIVHLEIEQPSISCGDGNSVAILTVIGETDGDEEENSYEASLKEDIFLPDVLWKSGEVTVEPNSKFEKVYSIELSCDEHCKVIGPEGSTHERKAEIYGYVLGDDLEWQTEQINVECIKTD
jgi:hypothetical protein